MSDFDLYDGQACPCGNDPACYQCGSGPACELHLAQEEAHREQMEEQEREYYNEIAAGISFVNLMEPRDD